MILRQLAPQLHIPYHVTYQPEDIPIVPTTYGTMWVYRQRPCVLNQLSWNVSWIVLHISYVWCYNCIVFAICYLCTQCEMCECGWLKLLNLLYTLGPFFMTYQNLLGRCLVCKHGSHVINIPKADWSSVKNKQLTATPC